MVQSAVVPSSAVTGGRSQLGVEWDHPDAENLGLGREITARGKVGGNKEEGRTPRQSSRAKVRSKIK